MLQPHLSPRGAARRKTLVLRKGLGFAVASCGGKFGPFTQVDGRRPSETSPLRATGAEKPEAEV